MPPRRTWAPKVGIGSVQRTGRPLLIGPNRRGYVTRMLILIHTAETDCMAGHIGFEVRRETGKE